MKFNVGDKVKILDNEHNNMKNPFWVEKEFLNKILTITDNSNCFVAYLLTDDGIGLHVRYDQLELIGE